MDDRPHIADSGILSGKPPPEPPHSFGLVRALRNSRAGLAYALASERAVRQEAIALILAIPVSFWITDAPFRRALLIASLLVVLIAELLNTGIEKVCDLVHPTPHPAIKAAKDMGSAAVLCAIAASALLWGAALWMRLS